MMSLLAYPAELLIFIYKLFERIATIEVQRRTRTPVKLEFN